MSFVNMARYVSEGIRMREHIIRDMREDPILQFYPLYYAVNHGDDEG